MSDIFQYTTETQPIQVNERIVVYINHQLKSYPVEPPLYVARFATSYDVQRMAGVYGFRVKKLKRTYNKFLLARRFERLLKYF